jgi:hypothetical protein
MMPTMWLIVEGDSDPKVIRRILEQKKIVVRVEPIFPEHGGRGVPLLAEHLETLINYAIQRKNPDDCIVVFHDIDETTNVYRKHYETINAICGSEKYKALVTLITAKDEIEAWLLADEGLCKWLRVKPNKKCDSIKKPSQKLNELIRKHNDRMKWNSRYWDDVLKYLDATGDKLSPSMRDSLKRLMELPCTQSKTL